MLAAGYTAVGEFHYLGVPEAHAAAEAAAAAGIDLRPPARRLRARWSPPLPPGVGREFIEQVESLRAAGMSVGVAPHSVRACPADWLEEIGRYASAEGLPLHVHADEQPKEIEECLAEHGCRPDRAARPHRLPDGAHDRRARDARRRRRARPPRVQWSDDLRLPDDRGRPRRRVPAGRARAHARDPDLRRLRLERPHRPVRGAARARGHRAPPDGSPRRVLDRGAVRIRPRRRRPIARSRHLAGDRGRPRPSVARRASTRSTSPRPCSPAAARTSSSGNDGPPPGV